MFEYAMMTMLLITKTITGSNLHQPPPASAASACSGKQSPHEAHATARIASDMVPRRRNAQHARRALVRVGQCSCADKRSGAGAPLILGVQQAKPAVPAPITVTQHICAGAGWVSREPTGPRDDETVNRCRRRMRRRSCPIGRV